MQITFILPSFIATPMGGVKVIHEYANRLTQMGHRIALVYPLITDQNQLTGIFKTNLRALYNRITKVTEDLYYTPDSRVTVLVVKKAIPRYLPKADFIVATGWQTAYWVAKLPADYGRKIYLLQHFETYFRQKQAVLATYHLPLTKIAIARWIIDKLNAIGENALGPLGNAINHTEFFLNKELSDRPIDIIGIYHHLKVKGPKDLIQTLCALKRRQNITAVLIASRRPVHHIPRWIKVVVRPSTESLRELYNSAKVFLHTSRSEGWGLPVMEAMACGCAIVASCNKGVLEYLVHNKNALLAPIGNIDTLRQQVTYLLDNENLRNTLVKNGLDTLNNYSWESLTNIFENILIQNSK
jgi:glycosyltransferase involved in cell wall biosynthesis